MADTVHMKFTGAFQGKQKVVDLPIPFKSNSDMLPEKLIFTRKSDTGPAFCQVPSKWATKLLELGGHWQVADEGK